ncbi:hypothetical protein EDC04DRAFT_2742155, partial [Pisolithus marmoratus]
FVFIHLIFVYLFLLRTSAMKVFLQSSFSTCLRPVLEPCQARHQIKVITVVMPYIRRYSTCFTTLHTVVRPRPKKLVHMLMDNVIVYCASYNPDECDAFKR